MFKKQLNRCKSLLQGVDMFKDSALVGVCILGLCR